MIRAATFIISLTCRVMFAGRARLFTFLVALLSGSYNFMQAGNDSAQKLTHPLFFRITLLATPKNSGSFCLVGRTIKDIETIKRKKHERFKTIQKSREVLVGIGYYYQAGLHHNLMALAQYNLLRTRGGRLYTSFAPILGLSRTLITTQTFTFDETGEITVKRLPGSWYLIGGTSFSAGWKFKGEKNFFFKDVSLGLTTLVMYPHFRFISLRGFFILGTSISLNILNYRVKKTIRHK